MVPDGKPNFYSSSIRRPAQRYNTPPPRSSLVASSLQRPPQRRRRLVFDCCVPSSDGGHQRPRVRPSLYFFVAPFDSPNDKQPSSPHVPTQPRLLSNAPPKSGCCVPPLIGGQLRPRYPLTPSFSISTPHFKSSQMSKPMTASATPTARGLFMVMGSGGAMIWLRLCSTHEERRAMPLEGCIVTVCDASMLPRR
jgi:hypothetical protein